MKKIALFICSHDGISCHYAGVGTAARGYIQGAYKLYEKLKNERIELFCYAITGKYLPTSYAYNQSLLDYNKSICEETGGQVLCCLNNSDGTYQFGDISNWNVASSSSATICSEIIEKNDFDEVIILGLDTPFAKTPLYVNKQLLDSNCKLYGIWVPHSTSLIHERGNFTPERITWETETVKEIVVTRNMYISYLNSYMKSHLNIEYNVPNSKLVPLLNGININEVPYYSQKSIISELKKYNIPQDKPLIMSFGRGASYKGFDIFLESIRDLKDLPVHFVLQVAFFDENDPLRKKLEHLSRNIDNLTLIFKLSYDFPRKLMQWKNTEIVCVLSRNEPGAFIPAEIRIYGQPIVIISNRDGLPCQVKDGIDGFIANIDSPKEVAQVIRKIYQLPENVKLTIRKKGKDLILKKYNIVNNFVEGIESILNKKYVRK